MDYSVGWTDSVVDMSINELSGIIWICVGVAMLLWVANKIAYSVKTQQVFLSSEVLWLMAFNSGAWGLLLFGIILFGQ